MEEKPLLETTHADELTAIAEVLRGNTDAFQLIVERYKALVFRLALSFLGSREEAEEAAQEIFFRAFKSLHRFSLDKRLLPWLYSIAINYLRSAYGRMRRREARIETGDHDFEELNVEAIATILGIGEENVKSRLFRARHKLRQILGKDATPAPESG